jgi:hypothetical protein
MERIPLEVMTAIINDKTHRSRIVGLTCKTLKPHNSLAIIDTKAHRLTRITDRLTLATERLEQELKDLACLARRITETIQRDHIYSDIQDLCVELRALWQQHFPSVNNLEYEHNNGDLCLREISPSGGKLQQHVTANVYSGDSVDEPCWASISVFYKLGPAGMMQIPFEHMWFADLVIRAHGVNRSRGTLRLIGQRTDGSEVRVEVSYRNGLMGGVLNAIGFY